MRADVDAASKRMSLKWGANRELDKVDSILLDDEVVAEMVRGTYDDRIGLLILSDRRLVFYSDGWTGSDHEDFRLDRVNSVGFSGGLMMSKLTIHASGNVVQIGHVNKGDGKRFAEASRKALHARAEAPARAESSDDEPIERLKKLAELRDAGVITEEEFAEKKAVLLNQIG